MIETLRALAEPNRFQIVELLRQGPRPVGDMVHQLHLSQPQVSKHLRVLHDAGLVNVRVDAQRRIYELRPAPLKELEVWLERYRRIGKANYHRLDALLVDMKANAIEAEALKTKASERNARKNTSRKRGRAKR
jgi:DNA-binding transcriptional ArsR family regulator